jgi:hypothetical protein
MARRPRKAIREHRKRTTRTLDYRVSVSVTESQHEFLAALAESKRVSIAWVVRDAVERLIAQDMPLVRGDLSPRESV